MLVSVVRTVFQKLHLWLCQVIIKCVQAAKESIQELRMSLHLTDVPRTVAHHHHHLHNLRLRKFHLVLVILHSQPNHLEALLPAARQLPLLLLIHWHRYRRKQVAVVPVTHILIPPGVLVNPLQREQLNTQLPCQD